MAETGMTMRGYGATAAPSLADQLRAQWDGDWNIGGIDRADELAGILSGRGITSLSGLKMGTGRKYSEGGGYALNEAGDMAPATEYNDGKYLNFGGTQIGNFGDRGKGNYRDIIGGGPRNDEFGWSSAGGKGAVGYSAVQDSAGQTRIVPGWNSSSDADDARFPLMALATVLTAGAAGGAFAGAGAGTGAGAGAGAGVGAFEGIGGLMATGGAPMTAAEFAAGAGGAGAGAAGVGEAGAGFFEGVGGNMAGGAGGAPMTAAEFAAGAGGGGASTSFDALRAAEKANMGQAAGNVPTTVNMGSLGGTTATSGGIKGLTDVAAQLLRDATASGEIGGSGWSQAGNTAANAVKDAGSAASAYQTWVKENPLLARVIAPVVGSLPFLVADKGGGGGGAAPTFTGPPKAWNSGLQMGIQPGAYQPRMTTAPGPVRPSTGMRMSGASRYFGG